VGVAGAGGVPGNASAVVMNATVTDTTAAGYLTVWPTGAPQPLASNLNWVPSQTVANLAVVPLGGGQVSVYDSAGTADVVADIVGWYG
jgi:hypothetical protein